jgi:arsenate reductase
MSHLIKIYHNPACGTSRNTLALIRNSGQEPEIIEYLNTPPSKDELIDLIKNSGLTIRQVIRNNVEPYKNLKLDENHWTDDELITFMLEYPILINRPFVVTELGVRLCRPSEKVLDILPTAQLNKFSKEDGELIIDDNLNRVK